MVGRKRKNSRKKPTLGNHQRSWIWGQHAVLEMLRAGRWQPLSVVICEELLDAALFAEAMSLLKLNSIEYRLADDAAEIENLIHARDHQGMAANMTEFPTVALDELMEGLPENPFLLLLDRVQDPFNFGSILRSADLFGVNGIIIGESEQVGVTSHVARSSVGAVNYLNIATVASLPETVQTLLEKSYQIVAATEKGTSSPSQIDLQKPVAIVIGNEGKGIQHELLALCNQRCAIPQVGHIDSLNAAVAAGILCYEVHRQRTTI
ncbi:23S rRNA (guanosine(2251)-2'-O)-methyltransferase RlmB [bacterium]|jgi:23S rRNA (guanosine2251-2'-O)-methyltransferase|nr:23S rRNA (guanosine(2251)-2'-O)-methyltransferase RlmB [bacterium]MDA7527833.1 23S rRNA (guanosine(2251)-2'-O)-methyltransferase RlmB [bacterium]